ncbi:MAG: Stp1/IreP family PP2C-type Ser/Thr phosphatase [Oscillospiraceae bacterium]|nr:Stp1/IreP family PP2C-type Ser/Thr phosphatase [Oscillospiraceae bacterium]MBQ3049261.1 Stp1/IreP family PP2C-type Ser/Thr phosphatase [Oscillospiraceae bacterium]
MIITAFGSDTGRIREVNQDMCVVRQMKSGEVFALVCDGMGGERGGNVASEIACRSMESYIETALEKKRSGSVGEMLTKAVETANKDVRKAAAGNAELKGMGTTAVGILVRDDCEHLHIVNVGDSRAYQVRGDGIRQLTHDHSFVQMMVDNGEITEEEARVHPKKHYITRAVGASDSIEADYIAADFKPGDIVLLCSDGFSNYFEINEIYRLLKEDAENLPQKLIDAANNRGGADNITVAVITKKD